MPVLYGRKAHEARRRRVLDGRQGRRAKIRAKADMLRREINALETTAERIKFYGQRTYMELVNLCFEQRAIPLSPGEKIRVRFVCVAASYWPSWHSVYAACLADERMDTRIILMDYEGGNVPQWCIQCKGAKNFLEAREMPFIQDAAYSPESDRPHFVFFQLPHNGFFSAYPKLRPDMLKAAGIRPLYCTYGIEYDESRNKNILTFAHYQAFAHALASPAFVMHEDIKEGYFRFCPGGGAHVAITGHPKFDIYSANHPLPEWVEAKRRGRKILFVQMHHPNNHEARHTYRTHSLPAPEMVNGILPWLAGQEDFFCIISLHPWFVAKSLATGGLRPEDISRMRSLLRESPNAVLYEGDYQACIAHADAFISGQSSLLLEMAFRKKPVLYLYDEPLALKPFAEEIFASFYHGRGYGRGLADVQAFLAGLRHGEDPLAGRREQVWQKYFSSYDGQIGARIKERMIAALSVENRC